MEMVLAQGWHIDNSGHQKKRNVCQGDFVTIRKGDDDAGSNQGDIDIVFWIARKMTGAAGVGDGEGRGRGRWDDVVAVKIIN